MAFFDDTDLNQITNQFRRALLFVCLLILIDRWAGKAVGLWTDGCWVYPDSPPHCYVLPLVVSFLLPDRKVMHLITNYSFINIPVHQFNVYYT